MSQRHPGKRRAGTARDTATKGSSGRASIASPVKRHAGHRSSRGWRPSTRRATGASSRGRLDPPLLSNVPTRGTALRGTKRLSRATDYDGEGKLSTLSTIESGIEEAFSYGIDKAPALRTKLANVKTKGSPGSPRSKSARDPTSTVKGLVLTEVHRPKHSKPEVVTSSGVPMDACNEVGQIVYARSSERKGDVLKTMDDEGVITAGLESKDESDESEEENDTSSFSELTGKGRRQSKHKEKRGSLQEKAKQGRQNKPPDFVRYDKLRKSSRAEYDDESDETDEPSDESYSFVGEDAPQCASHKKEMKPSRSQKPLIILKKPADKKRKRGSEWRYYRRDGTRGDVTAGSASIDTDSPEEEYEEPHDSDLVHSVSAEKITIAQSHQPCTSQRKNGFEKIPRHSRTLARIVTRRLWRDGGHLELLHETQPQDFEVRGDERRLPPRSPFSGPYWTDYAADRVDTLTGIVDTGHHRHSFILPPQGPEGERYYRRSAPVHEYLNFTGYQPDEDRKTMEFLTPTALVTEPARPSRADWPSLAPSTTCREHHPRKSEPHDTSLSPVGLLPTTREEQNVHLTTYTNCSCPVCHERASARFRYGSGQFEDRLRLQQRIRMEEEALEMERSRIRKLMIKEEQIRKEERQLRLNRIRMEERLRGDTRARNDERIRSKETVQMYRETQPQWRSAFQDQVYAESVDNLRDDHAKLRDGQQRAPWESVNMAPEKSRWHRRRCSAAGIREEGKREKRGHAKDCRKDSLSSSAVTRKKRRSTRDESKSTSESTQITEPTDSYGVAMLKTRKASRTGRETELSSSDETFRTSGESQVFPDSQDKQKTESFTWRSSAMIAQGRTFAQKASSISSVVPQKRQSGFDPRTDDTQIAQLSQNLRRMTTDSTTTYEETMGFPEYTEKQLPSIREKANTEAEVPSVSTSSVKVTSETWQKTTRFLGSWLSEGKVPRDKDATGAIDGAGTTAPASGGDSMAERTGRLQGADSVTEAAGSTKSGYMARTDTSQEGPFMTLKSDAEAISLKTEAEAGPESKHEEELPGLPSPSGDQEQDSPGQQVSAISIPQLEDDAVVKAVDEFSESGTEMFPESGIVALISVLCITWIIMVLVTSSLGHDHNRTTSASLPTTLPVTPSSLDDIYYCDTERCLREGSYLGGLLKKAQQPCDNFYEHVCGRWQQFGKPWSGEPFWVVSTDTILEEDIQGDLVSFLRDPSSATSVTLAAELYSACTERTSVPTSAVDDAKDMFSSWAIKAWPVRTFEGDNLHDEVWRFAGDLVRDLRVYGLAVVTVAVNPNDRHGSVIGLDEPKPLYFPNDSASHPFTTVLNGALMETLTAFGEKDASERHQLAREVLSVFDDLQLKFLSWPPPKNARLFKVQQLHFGFRLLLKSVFYNVKNVDNHDYVLVFRPRFAEVELPDVTRTMNPRFLLNYLGFRALVSLAPFLPDSLSNLQRLFFLESSGRLGPLSAPKLCLRAVNYALPACLLKALALPLADSGAALPYHHWLLELEATFLRGLPQASWLDDFSLFMVAYRMKHTRVDALYPSYLVQASEPCAIGQHRLPSESALKVYYKLVKLQQEATLKELPGHLDWRISPALDMEATFDLYGQTVRIPVGMVNRSLPANDTLFALHLARVAVRMYSAMVPLLYEGAVYERETGFQFTETAERHLEDLRVCLLSDLYSQRRRLGLDRLGPVPATSQVEWLRDWLLEQTTALDLGFWAFRQLLHVGRIYRLDFRYANLRDLSATQLFFVYYALDQCERSDIYYQRRQFRLQQRPSPAYVSTSRCATCPHFRKLLGATGETQ